MAEPTPLALASLLTRLVGRDVAFAQLTRPVPSKSKQVYGVYTTVPGGAHRVVQADLPLLGSLAGALVGLPPESIRERLASSEVDEMLRDAIYEILNVTSAVISPDARSVFQNVYTDPLHLPDEAADILRQPLYRSYFNVTVQGYTGGAFFLFA